MAEKEVEYYVARTEYEIEVPDMPDDAQGDEEEEEEDGN